MASGIKDKVAILFSVYEDEAIVYCLLATYGADCLSDCFSFLYANPIH